MKHFFILIITILLSLNAFAADNNEESNRYLERAKKKMAAQNYTEALDALQKARIKQPENSEIFYLMGDCNRKLRNFSEFVKNYAYAKALDARNENILVDGALKLSKLF